MRTKSPADRIRYYVRKVTVYGQRKMEGTFVPRNRYERLLTYRDAMRRRLTE